MLLAFVETAPLLVQAAAAGVPACFERGVDLGPAGSHRRTGIAIGGPVVPGRLDQQSAYVSTAGFGDRALNPRGARGVLGRNKADIGADRGPGEPGRVPISTDSAKPVSAEIPRRQPSRLTGSAHRGEAAIVTICSSRRSRAAVADNTASK